MTSHNMFFIDSRVTDYQALISTLPVEAEWALINAEEDGVKQMQSYLVGKYGYNSLQIISHGSKGALYLGSTILSNTNINTYAANLASIGQSLTNTGDILLYGCNVAQGIDGEAFINFLSQYTEADVAASTDLTGKNGDWVLESTVGAVEASSINASNFSVTLATSTGNVIITGITKQGQVLTASNTIADTSGIISYAWKADGISIANANANAIISTLTLAEAQVGKVITVVATDSLGTVDPVTSIATSAVINVNDAPTGVVTISSAATQGQILTIATNTIADLDGLGPFIYQWKANNIDITGATSSTLTIAEAQVGKVITLSVSYTDGHGTFESAYSSPTSTVTNINDIGTLTISGTLAQNQILTAVVNDLDGLGAGTIIYEWKADGTIVSTASTLTLAEAQVGKVITVTANYTDGHGTIEALTSAASGIVINVNDPPTGTVTIGGTSTQGQTLTAANTLADLDGLGTISYQWKAAGVNISGATSSTLILAEAQVGNVITVAANYTDGHGTTETVTSSATSAIVNVNDLPTGSITITGLATQGQTLNVSNTLIDVDSIGTISYQWIATSGNGTSVNISGATSSTLILAEAQVGNVITVVAKYTDGHGTPETITSAATGAVSNVNDAGTVIINGTVALNQTLTANATDADGLDPSTISYQWKADGNFISGATNNTFTLTQAQVGKVITVVASYTDNHGTVESVTSIANNNPPTGLVTIGGIITQGQILTASNTLVDLDGLGAINYQWQAAGANISGATNSTLTLTEAQVGKVITVVASYTDNFGRAESVASTASIAVVNVNDAPTGAVTTTGSVAQGQILTASNTLADADGLGIISYEWKAGGISITGASSNTLTLTEAQMGKVITVVASYTDGHGTAESVTSTATSTVTNVNDMPTGLVTITGTVAQGQILTASNTLADADGLGTISYQWKVNGISITGATNNTLTITEAQVGKVITVVASYTDGIGTAETVTSTATSTVTNFNDVPTGLVTITGFAAQGQILTASNTLADADGLGTISYQWKVNGISITGATNNTLTITEAQVGKVVTVVASYKDGHGSIESVISTATNAVANENDVPTGFVTISGTVTQGQILTASNNVSDADGLGAISYQWNADGNIISGATSSTLTLAEAQVGKVITVVASYKDGRGTAETFTSSSTSAVTNTNDTGTVTVTGTVAQGKILTAETNDPDGLGTISYQWKAGNININGATNSTYLLTKAEADKAITVTANYIDDHGTEEFVTSSPTSTFIGIVVINNGSFTGGASGEIIMGSAGAGADNMIGGDGGDIYTVDNIGDKITEGAGTGSGIDEVQSSISYKLGNNIEKLTLTGKFGLTGTGNDLVNTLTGNVGNNILDGGKKTDTYIGGNGHDTYLLDEINETAITEYSGEGNDTIKLKVNASGNYQMPDNVENLILTGSGLINVMGNDNNNAITGNTKANQLYGGAGDDKLAGNLGNDVLTGGDGGDTFIFDTAPSKNNLDTIIDFSTGDVIELNVRVFKQLLGETGGLSYYFENIVAHGKASAKSSLILYDITTGYLYYDADGSGKKAAILIGILDDGAGYHAALTGADFNIV